MTEKIIEIVLSAVIPSLITGLTVYIKSIKKNIKSNNDALKNNNDALKEGMLSLLRAELIRQHDKWTTQDYCPIYAKDALEKAYNAYHQLGGNGTMTQIYKETMALDTESKSKTEE